MAIAHIRSFSFPQDASAAIFGSLVAFRGVLLQSFHQTAQQFRWRVTPVHSSGVFSLLIKDVKQRKLSFYGGRAKHFVKASAGKKNKWGIIRGKNFNKHCKN